MEVAYNGKTINSVRVSDLSSYLQVLIANYQAKGKGRPSDLTSLQKVFYDVEHMDKGLVSENDNKVRQRLDNIIKLMETTSVENKDLKELQNVSKKDYSNTNKDVQKRYKQAVLDFEKIVSKVKNKYPELNRSSFSVMKDNLARGEAKKMSPFYNDNGDFCVIYKGKERASKSWKLNVEDYITSLKNEMSRIQGFSSEVEVNEVKRDEERLKVIEDYGNMVHEGKIESIDGPEKVNFFAKLKFSPMKKSTSVKEIVNKLSDIDYALDLMNVAISEVSNTTSINYKETLTKLQEMKKKYSSVKLQTEEQLKNSGYYDMEKKVNEQREKEKRELDEEYLRGDLRAKFLRLLNVEDKEMEKDLIKEIKAINLPEDVKNDEKKKAAEQYKAEQLEKESEKKIVNEEKEALHDVRAQSANNLRQEAIEELERTGEQYVENGMDVRAAGGIDEQKINREMEIIQAKREKAFNDLKTDGIIPRNANIDNLDSEQKEWLEYYVSSMGDEYIGRGR